MGLLSRLKQRFCCVRHEGESRVAYAEERLDDALALARSVYEFDLDNAWANYLLACSHLESDRYAEAVPHLERVAQRWPEDAWTWDALGLCHDRLSDPKSAAAAYRKALALEPDRPLALKNLGRALYLLGDYPGAEEALGRYCDILAGDEGDDREAHDLLGYICYRQGKFQLSYGHYERARSLDPLNPKLERNARLLYSHSARS